MLVSFFTTRPVCDAHGRSTAPHCKHFTKPRSVEGSMMIRKKNPWTKTKLVPFWTFVSEDQGLIMCIDTEVSSPVHRTAWTRKSRGVTQWARQSSEFAPEIGKNGYGLKSHRHQHRTDCTQASQIPPGRASADRLLSSDHQRTGKTHRNHAKFRLVKDDGM